MSEFRLVAYAVDSVVDELVFDFLDHRDDSICGVGGVCGVVDAGGLYIKVKLQLFAR